MHSEVRTRKDVMTRRALVSAAGLSAPFADLLWQKGTSRDLDNLSSGKAENVRGAVSITGNRFQTRHAYPEGRFEAVTPCAQTSSEERSRQAAMPESHSGSSICEAGRDAVTPHGSIFSYTARDIRRFRAIPAWRPCQGSGIALRIAKLSVSCTRVLRPVNQVDRALDTRRVWPRRSDGERRGCIFATRCEGATISVFGDGPDARLCVCRRRGARESPARRRPFPSS